MSSDAIKKIPFNSTNENFSISSLYEARKFYEDLTLPYITSSYLDEILTYADKSGSLKISFNDLYKENALYGYIDPDGDVIAPIENSNNFKKVDTKFVMQNFAADAFNEMRVFLNAQALKQCLDRSSPFYNLTVVDGYASNDDLYISTSTIVANKFREYCLEDIIFSNNIKSVKDFNREFILFLKKHLQFCPVTKSRMTLFYNFKKFSNSLTVKVSNQDPGNDEKKYINFYLDRGFLLFSEACRFFGFKIDKSNPFIITTDLYSPQLKKYYLKYNLNNVKDIFTKRYKKIFLEDVESLKEYFYNAYGIFLIDNPSYGDGLENICSGNGYDRYKYQRPNLSKIDYLKNFSEAYWYNLYIYFKNYELEAGFNQTEYENLCRQTDIYVKYGRNYLALKFINERFNELKGVHYYDTLHKKQGVLEVEELAVGALGKPDIIFRG